MSQLRKTVMALSLLAILVFLSPIAAAPAPEPAPTAPLEKYFPDDANGVVVFNVKQALSSPVFTKNYQKKVEELLKMDQVQPWLKDGGFDPLKDIDRIAAVMAPSGQPMNAPGSGAPLLIVQGRFDLEKFVAKADQIVKDGLGGGIIKSSKAGEATLYEVGFPFGPTIFICLVDKNTLMAAPVKDMAVEALDRAAGRKSAKMKNPALQKLLEKMDPKQAVNVAFLGEMIVGGGVTTNIKGGGNVTETHTITLADQGIEAIQGSMTIADDIKGKVAISAKNVEKAKELGKIIEAGLAQAIKEGEKEAARMKELTSVVDMLKTVKTGVKEDTITLEGQGGPDIIQSLFTSFFFARAESRPVPAGAVPPPCPE